MSEKKLCPILVAGDRDSSGNNGCLGEACAVYVKIHKPRALTDGHINFCDPEAYLKYEGCGLVQQIPWTLVKVEDEPKNAEGKKEVS